MKLMRLNRAVFNIAHSLVYIAIFRKSARGRIRNGAEERLRDARSVVSIFIATGKIESRVQVVLKRDKAIYASRIRYE